MEKILLNGPTEISYDVDQRQLYYVDGGKLSKRDCFPAFRVEPELFINYREGAVVQGQYKWSANCCHLLYDIMSDYFIAKNLFGVNSIVQKPFLSLSNQIFSFLNTEVLTGNLPEDNQACVPDPDQKYIFVDNPWRHSGHHHSFISNTIYHTFSDVPNLTETPKNIIIYRRLGNRKFNRNIHQIEKFKDDLSDISGLRFEIVNLEDYDLIGQINLFRNAEKIISPHGSGLVWLNFCAPGAKCIEIFSPYFMSASGMPRYDFWVTANHVGVKYRALYLESYIGSPSDPYELELVVDPAHIYTILEES